MRNVLIREVASFQEVNVNLSKYRGVFISGCWNKEVLLYAEVSSFQGVGIKRFPLYTELSSFQGVGIRGSTVYRGVLISGG